MRCLPEWAPDAALDALVLLVAAACLFWGLGGPPIRDNNEALYADIAWAMARGGSWIIPHLDGVPYIEKPPLLYWLIALSFKAFGVGTWQARLPDALAAWLISARRWIAEMVDSGQHRKAVPTCWRATRRR